MSPVPPVVTCQRAHDVMGCNAIKITEKFVSTVFGRSRVKTANLKLDFHAAASTAGETWKIALKLHWNFSSFGVKDKFCWK